MFMNNRNMNRRRRCALQNINCRELPVMPNDPQLANAYVPYQYAEELFKPMDAIRHGTAFPELVSPYTKNQSQCVIAYLSQTETCEEVDHCE